MKTFQQFQEDISNLPGLGGGGGGTDSISAVSKSKSLKKRVGDVGKVLTRPFRKVKKDPTEKFASEEVNKKVPPVASLGGGGGGTNAITMKSKSKTIGNYMKDAFKIATFPFSRRNIKADPSEKFASEYVEADSSNNEFGNITSSMVNKPRVQTVVQPVIQTKTQQVPTPVPMSSKTQVIKTTKSKLPPSIAKMIN